MAPYVRGNQHSVLRPLDDWLSLAFDGRRLGFQDTCCGNPPRAPIQGSLMKMVDEQCDGDLERCKEARQIFQILRGLRL